MNRELAEKAGQRLIVNLMSLLVGVENSDVVESEIEKDYLILSNETTLVYDWLYETYEDTYMNDTNRNNEDGTWNSIVNGFTFDNLWSKMNELKRRDYTSQTSSSRVRGDLYSLFNFSKLVYDPHEVFQLF